MSIKRSEYYEKLLAAAKAAKQREDEQDMRRQIEERVAQETRFPLDRVVVLGNGIWRELKAKEEQRELRLIADTEISGAAAP